MFKLEEMHRRTFENDGIVKLPGAIDAELLEALNRCFDWAVANPGPTLIGDAEGDEFSFVDLGNPAGRAMYEEVLRSSHLPQLASALWQSKYVGFLGEEVFWKKGRADATFWHQDTAYAPWSGAHWVNFWMPLVPHAAEYAIRVIRSSHKGVLYDGTTFNSSDPTEPMWGDAADFPRLPDIDGEISSDPNAWDIVSFDVEPGDIVAIHPHSLHSGGPADEKMSERRTLVFRFFGDEAYYSDHIPNVPGMYENDPIPASSGGVLKDGDLFRPPGSTLLGSA